MFPKKNIDGSFCFKANYLVCKPISLDSINKWIENWVDENRNHKIFGREYFTEYSEKPSIELNGAVLTLIFVVNPDGEVASAGRMWKDWFVYLTKDMLKENLNIEKLVNCENT